MYQLPQPSLTQIGRWQLVRVYPLCTQENIFFLTFASEQMVQILFSVVVILQRRSPSYLKGKSQSLHCSAMLYFDFQNPAYFPFLQKSSVSRTVKALRFHPTHKLPSQHARVTDAVEAWELLPPSKEQLIAYSICGSERIIIYISLQALFSTVPRDKG